MDVRQLQTLVAVADGGSFAAAARIVNLTPSAVSQQIQALEGEIGSPIFNRNTRPPRLNARGEEMVRAARSVVEILTEARLAISGARTAGLLSFGAIRTVSMRIVPAALARMRVPYPALSYDLSVGMSEILMADVAAGRLDAALVAENVGVPSNLVWTPLLSEPLVLIAPPESAVMSESALLESLPFIRYSANVPLARQIETELSRHGKKIREIAVANTMPSVVGLVRAGFGCAVVPQIAARDEPQGSLFCREFRNGTVTRRLGLVQRRVSSRSQIVVALRHAISEVAVDAGFTTL